MPLFLLAFLHSRKRCPLSCLLSRQRRDAPPLLSHVLRNFAHSIPRDSSRLLTSSGMDKLSFFSFGLVALTARLTPVILSNHPLGARNALAAPWYHLADTKGIFSATLGVFLGLVTHITWTASVTMSCVFWAGNPNYR